MGAHAFVIQAYFPGVFLLILEMIVWQRPVRFFVVKIRLENFREQFIGIAVPVVRNGNPQLIGSCIRVDNKMLRQHGGNGVLDGLSRAGFMCLLS